MNVIKDRAQEIKQELAELKLLQAKAKEHKHNLSKMGASRYSFGNEYEIQERLEKHFISNKIPYQKEVCIENGRMDFIAGERIYEVKKLWNSQDLFNAIGQLTYYNKCHDDKYIPVVCSESFTSKQKKILKRLNIEWRAM